MSTLVLHLSGPIQSWGEQSQFNKRSTLGYPTYSGLFGLLRAALGVTRDGRLDQTGDAFDPTAIRDLQMAIRIDKPGRELWDYHTINPPDRTRYSNIGHADRQKLATIAVGSGVEWRIKKKGAKRAEPQTLVTYRSYLQDAAFLWLISGDDLTLDLVGAAISQPRWQLSLGRKSCLPDFPIILGRSELGADELARTTPACIPGLDMLAFHALGRHLEFATRTVYHHDDPIGSHPHQGYTAMMRSITYVEPPRVPDRASLVSWCSENLK